MKSTVVGICILSFLIAVGASAQEFQPGSQTYTDPRFTDGASFFVSPSLRYTAGETEYVMDIVGFDPEYGPVRLKSQLEFPLDGVLGGGTVGMHINRGGRPIWRFALGVWTNINDPGGTMYDHDWANFYTGTFEKFSYTESEVEMKALLINLRGSWEFLSRESWGLSLLAGYRYQKIEQDVIGFTGWQLVNNSLDPTIYEQFFFSYPGILGIIYEVTFSLPHAGLQFDADFGRKASMGASAAYAIVMADDRDDHVLRTKLSTADITGNGFIGDVNLEVSPMGTLGRGLFLNFSGELAYYSAAGTQTQYWYGAADTTEDPDTGEPVPVEPGTTLTGIPHDINSLQFQAGVNVGVRF